MKKEDFIKLGLDEEFAEKCAEKSGEELRNYIPKARFDEVNNERKKLEIDVKERDVQLENLKGSVGNVDELKTQIEKLQEENKQKDEAHNAEVKQLKLNAAVDAAITNAKGKNLKAIKALLDLENVEIEEDGTVKGIAEQLDALVKAEDSNFLFNTDTKKLKGTNVGESISTEGQVDISKMTYTELAAYMAENPDVKL